MPKLITSFSRELWISQSNLNSIAIIHAFSFSWYVRYEIEYDIASNSLTRSHRSCNFVILLRAYFSGGNTRYQNHSICQYLLIDDTPYKIIERFIKLLFNLKENSLRIKVFFTRLLYICTILRHAITLVLVI